ncbi:hypothetical protein BCAR13_60051 [Paraburkholderia caribensis]|nr:hypothetical protein BCAR13_60051 [Paraburkholderia caribensis]
MPLRRRWLLGVLKTTADGALSRRVRRMYARAGGMSNRGEGPFGKAARRAAQPLAQSKKPGLRVAV